jgi:secreted trypsin-like serine protease
MLRSAIYILALTTATLGMKLKSNLNSKVINNYFLFQALPHSYENKVGEQRINESPQGKRPYVVSLQWKQGGHQCTGSIIADKWVITAAACLHK